MSTLKEIQLASEMVERPAGPPHEDGDLPIRTDAVYVIHTRTDETLAAIDMAGDFAKAMNVPVTVVHFRAVPYALPVDQPTGVSPIETAAFAEHIAVKDVDVRVRVYLCRDVRPAIPQALKPRALVVVGGRPRWWPSESNRWRRPLTADGHYVVFANGARPGLSSGSPRSVEEERSHA